MKVKDLPKDTIIGNLLLDLIPLKVYYNNVGFDKGYITSVWNRGLWLKRDKEDEEVHPAFLKDSFIYPNSEVIMNLEIIEENNPV